MKKIVTLLLVVIAIAAFAGALYYPLNYLRERRANESDLDELRAIRRAALARAMETAAPEPTASEFAEHPSDGQASLEEATGAEAKSANPNAVEGTAMNPSPEDEARAEASQTGANADVAERSSPAAPAQDGAALTAENAAPAADNSEAEEPTSKSASGEGISEGTQAPLTPASEPDAPRAEPPGDPASEPAALLDEAPPEADGPLPYYEKAKRALDEALILPQYRELYALNHDLVGWLLIDSMGVDYPVMQTPEDDEYYLHRDFYGKSNANGQLILDKSSDALTPSYNQIIYGHNMKSGAMFGNLIKYKDLAFWRENRLLEFDNLMEERLYVVVAAFYGVQPGEDEPGFRYAVDFQDEAQYADWMAQVKAEQCYETGVDCRFGDEFVTLSTCAYHRENGRFVVVARRLREGEALDAQAG